jgi:hypothetical protein
VADKAAWFAEDLIKWGINVPDAISSGSLAIFRVDNVSNAAGCHLNSTDVPSRKIQVAATTVENIVTLAWQQP